MGMHTEVLEPKLDLSSQGPKFESTPAGFGDSPPTNPTQEYT
jgi:hypothetical protein